jgi:hypothetical protein
MGTKSKNFGMGKHVRNNTLFDNVGISNYEYALQGQTHPLSPDRPTDEVKIVEAPKYEYYITPKETRDEI